MFEIRDPIHRTIPFTEREKKVIGHPFVQRLRYVRQLGWSFLTYPGATHDRFSHAIGAMHVVGRIWDGVLETSGGTLRRHFSDGDLAYLRDTLRFAALMHDLGHPPFSHVSEKFMPKLGALALPSGWMPDLDPQRQATHEDYSIVLVAALAADAALGIPPSQAQDIASLIHHGVVPSGEWLNRFGTAGGAHAGVHSLLRSLISGELDCDRMDYLLRDAYFTGVAYGTHDIDFIVGNLVATYDETAGFALTIDSTAVRAFEDFLLARYHMFIQVYLHKTTIAFDHFLEQAIGYGEFGFDIPGDAQGYAHLRDSTVIERMFAAAESEANAWSRRLVQRLPPRMLLSASNARDDERVFMAECVAALKTAGVPFFLRKAWQYLSKPSAKNRVPFLVRKKMLGRLVYEPIEQYSDLLKKYNEVIDSTMLYVLPEDREAAMMAVRFLQPASL